jgi:hypothetical protein
MKKSISVLLMALVVFAACEEDKSSNADLSDLVLTPTISGYIFTSTDTNQIIRTPSGATSIGITPMVSDSSAALRLRTAYGTLTNWTATGSGSLTTIPLVSGGYTRRDLYGNVLDIEVSAEDGTKKIYIFTFQEE